MSRPKRNKAAKPEVKSAFSRFAPASFRSIATADVQRLCDDLAHDLASYFAARVRLEWKPVGTDVARQLRLTGHDLCHFDETDELQEWQAEWHNPRGAFSLLLSFRSSGEVQVTFRANDTTYVARG